MSFGSGPVRNSVSGVDGDVGGLHVNVYGWCSSILSAFLIHSHELKMFHSSDCITLVWFPSVVVGMLSLRGDFFRPRMLTAFEIGANEDIQMSIFKS